MKPSYYSAIPRMRIAQIAPLYELIPPKLYGGTERIVSYITEGFVRRGHDVTLFAAGDADQRQTASGVPASAAPGRQAGARRIPATPDALRRL
jgi:hypothetical protein